MITTQQFRRALEAVLVAVSKDKYRLALTHVSFRSDAIEGTDGHRLVRVETPAGFITRTGCATVYAVRRYVGWLKFDPSPNVEAAFPDAAMLPFSDVQFPTTEHLWPKETATQAFAIGLKSQYLGDLAKVGKLVDAPGDCVRFEMGKSAETAVVFTFPGATLTAKYLLMPMRLPDAAEAVRAA